MQAVYARSFSISLSLHLGILVLTGISLIKAPQFAVDRGLSGIEINLVAAPAEVAPPPTPAEPIAEPKADVVPQDLPREIPREIAPPVVKPVTPPKIAGNDEVTTQAQGGAITEAKPDYLKNPAPAYPLSARRRGQEGTVLLVAAIDQNGSAVKVDIEESSGYAVLDEAARKSVRLWRFKPARLGSVSVPSTVRVPVKFDLRP